MKFVINSSRIKVFAKTVLTAGRYAEQVAFIINDQELIIEAINKMKTAIFTVCFQRDFFSTFETETGNCQILTKCCVLAFRSPNTLDKRMKTLTFKTDEARLKAVVEIEYQRKNTRRTLKLPFISYTPMHNIQETGTNYRLVASAKVLASGFHHFIKGVDSVLMVVTSDAIRFENQDIGGIQSMRTSFKFFRREFQEIVVQGTAKIIFSLKSLKILLNLMDPKTSPLTVTFSENGKPVFFKANHKSYKAKLVLATIMNTRVIENADISISRDYLSDFNITASTTSQANGRLLIEGEAGRLSQRSQDPQNSLPANERLLNNQPAHRLSQRSQDPQSSLPANESHPVQGTLNSQHCPSRLFDPGDLSNIEQASSFINGRQTELSFRVNVVDEDRHISSNLRNSLNGNDIIAANIESQNRNLNVNGGDLHLELDSGFNFPTFDDNVINDVKDIAANVDRLPKQFHSEEARMRFLGFGVSSTYDDEDDYEVFASATDSESDD